jgi:hypothetical protein
MRGYLRNNPPHAEDWKRAILEGLKRNNSLDLPDSALPFELVYWRDWNYLEGIDPTKDDEPYMLDKGTGPFLTYRQHWPDVFLSEGLERSAKPLDWAKQHFGVDILADTVLQRRLPDLGLYYNDEVKRTDLRRRLREALIRHEGKRIMLIAHSMGTIVAYDVLRELGNERPAFTISHLVTLGSPLGLPHVLFKITREHLTARTPSIVEQWSNFADRRDPVAADTHLADDYDENARGVTVRDQLVLNTYHAPGTSKPNPHKIWGYLRAPEVSAVLKTFI